MNVKKRNGELEELNQKKINKLVEWACDGYDANPSDIIMNANIKIYDGIKTTKIHEVLVKSCEDLISENASDYQFVATRLFSFYVRKQVFGVFLDEEMPHVVSLLVDDFKTRGYYDETLLDKFTSDEWDKINNFIDHSADEKLSIAGYKKMFNSYLIKNRINGYVFETPQYAFILFACTLFSELKDIKEYYNLLKGKWLNQPTPIMSGVRTKTKQFASCVLIDIDDDMESISSSNHATQRYVTRKAGIGHNVGRIRDLGSPIRGGQVVHTGKIPFLKQLESTVKSCSQGGIRNGASTVHYPCWTREIKSLLVLKNNKGTDENRVRKMDYSIQISKLFLLRMLKGESISLFSTSDVKGLYEIFGTPEFDDKYLEYEKSDIPRDTINGTELLSTIVTERMNTGRIYIQCIDNVNTYNMFQEVIHMSNLCQEISLPTKPIYHIDDDSGEIALCMLGGINLGKLSGSDTFYKLEKPIKFLLRGLDKVMDMQEYVVKASEKQIKRRSVGVGVTNMAYLLAKNNIKYGSKESFYLVDELFEHIQYYLIKASMELAKEKGECEWFHKTKYAQGILPIDLYCKRVDEIVDRKHTLDWEKLRNDVMEHGMRNSVLSAIMPSESSSVVTNATNGIEPPLGLITHKQNGDNITTMVVPSIKSLRKYYTMAWEIKNSDINKMTGIIQKWVDQAISVNHYYNPKNYDSNKIPADEVIVDIKDFYKYGGKNLYYANTNDNIKGFDDMSSGCDEGGCTI